MKLLFDEDLSRTLVDRLHDIFLIQITSFFWVWSTLLTKRSFATLERMNL